MRFASVCGWLAIRAEALGSSSALLTSASALEFLTEDVTERVVTKRIWDRAISIGLLSLAVLDGVASGLRVALIFHCL